METVVATENLSPCFAHPFVSVLKGTETNLTYNNTRLTYSFVTEGKTVKYAVAFCAPADQFSKRIGRQISEGRLSTHPHVIENIDTTNMQNVHGAIQFSIQSHLPVTWLNIHFKE